MAEFSFIEISYDPSITSPRVMKTQLENLGFIHRTQHVYGPVGFWNLNKCILLLRSADTKRTPNVTGIGFNGEFSHIDKLNCKLDKDTDFFYTDNSHGLRTYILQENQIHNVSPTLEASYKIIDNKTASATHLNYISGIKLNAHSTELIEHYIAMGFKYTDVSENYGKLICENNRFTIMLDKRNSTNDVPTLICDTHDVFNATAYFVGAGLKLKRFNKNIHQNFGELNYKIVAYNCRAWGNEKSYTIENFIEGISPGIDIIFRQRNQYLHIQETTLDSYYATEH